MTMVGLLWLVWTSQFGDIPNSFLCRFLLSMGSQWLSINSNEQPLYPIHSWTNNPATVLREPLERISLALNAQGSSVIAPRTGYVGFNAAFGAEYTAVNNRGCFTKIQGASMQKSQLFVCGSIGIIQSTTEAQWFQAENLESEPWLSQVLQTSLDLFGVLLPHLDEEIEIIIVLAM